MLTDEAYHRCGVKMQKVVKRIGKQNFSPEKQVNFWAAVHANGLASCLPYPGNCKNAYDYFYQGLERFAKWEEYVRSGEYPPGFMYFNPRRKEAVMDHAVWEAWTARAFLEELEMCGLGAPPEGVEITM